MKKLIMEFLGTFFLVLAVAMNAGAVAIASMLMAWIYIGNYISGAHFNPLVTVAVGLRDKWHAHHIAKYIVAQLLGGIAAYELVLYLKGSIAITAPAADATIWQALIVEILLAFVFALLILFVTTIEHIKSTQLFGLIIGFSIPALARVGAPISGGLFNPAIAVGSILTGFFSGTSIIWEHLFMYVGGAVIGAVIAVYAFRYFTTESYKAEFTR